MNAIKVEYTVKDDFVETNKANIQKVMEKLKSLNVPGVTYSSWTKEDGKSFVHILITDDGVTNPLPETDEFKQFQAELKQNLENPPSFTELSLVGASFK